MPHFEKNKGKKQKLSKVDHIVAVKWTYIKVICVNAQSFGTL